jgi:hypothetical protein
VAGIIDLSVNFLFPTYFLAGFEKPPRAGEVLSKTLLIIFFSSLAEQELPDRKRREEERIHVVHAVSSVPLAEG